MATSRPYRAANRERLAQYDAAYRAAHREQRKTAKAAWRASNRDKIAAYNAAHAEEIREYMRAWRAKNPETKRAHHRKSKYGLSAHDYASRLASQDGRCAICREPLIRPQVDHDHATGIVRGILCVNCNNGLARFRDDAQFLTAAIAYLTPSTLSLPSLDKKADASGSGASSTEKG